MGNLIPFLYYDIFARVVPGALTLGVLRWCASTWSGWNSLKVIAKGDSESWRAVVVPLVIGGVCYVIGTLYEIGFATPPVRRLLRLDSLSDKAFRGAWLKHLGKELPRNKGKSKHLWHCIRMVRRWLWEDLVHKTSASSPPPFAHAHRFQAEARMCLHSLLPTLAFTVRACWLAIKAAEADGGASSTNEWRWFVVLGAVGLAMTAFLVWCFYVRELRRWLQLLNSTEHLDEAKRPVLKILRERFPPQEFTCLRSILND